jgi:hypothetical protein
MRCLVRGIVALVGIAKRYRDTHVMLLSGDKTQRAHKPRSCLRAQQTIPLRRVAHERILTMGRDVAPAQRGGDMQGAKWSVVLAALAAIAMGCSDDERRPPTEPRPAPLPSESPAPATPVDERPFSERELARLDKLIGRAEFPDRIGPRFGMRDVYYTSPTDAVADFVRDGRGIEDWASAIATTDDNWDHVTTLVLPHHVANGFEYAPGRNKLQTAPGAPRLFGHFGVVGIDVSGGMIVARTGNDSVAVSKDGHRWTEVTPGR